MPSGTQIMFTKDVVDSEEVLMLAWNKVDPYSTFYVLIKLEKTQTYLFQGRQYSKLKQTNVQMNYFCRQYCKMNRKEGSKQPPLLH